MNLGISRRVRFGDFELDLEAKSLKNGHGLVHLNAQPARLLALLVSRAGDLVTREEIQAELWGEQTFVDFEQGINHCIRQIRTTLRDDADSPRFIKTVPRQGYCFLVMPEPIDTPPEAHELPAAPPRQIVATAAKPRRRAFWVAASVVAAVVLVSLSARLLASRPAPLLSKPTLAVLPFQDVGPAPHDGFPEDALTEDLIIELGRRYSGRLGVIARTSAMSFRGTSPNREQIRKTLGADYLLEGTVRQSGDAIRVTARLVRTSDGMHLWAGRYDRTLSDLLQLHERLGESIAQALALRLVPPESGPLQAASTTSPAYEAYLRGRAALGAPSPGFQDRAVAAFQESIKADPGFAPAYLGVAQATLYRPRPRREVVPQAEEWISKALALDDSDPQAHLLLANLLFYFDLKPEEARREFERALEIHPDFAEAHHAYAAWFSIHGRHDEALAQVRQALQLDPVSPMVNSDVGWYSFFARRYPEATEASRRALRINPNDYWASRCIVVSESQLGRLDTAATQALADMRQRGLGEMRLRQLEPLTPRETLEAFWKWELQGAAGERPEMPQTASDRALAYLALGDRDKAMKELETAFEQRSGWILPFIPVDPRFDPLRKDPDFRNLMARMSILSDPSASR